ncbi:hypothetical protein Tco_1312753 [Tanacetum coccineum]
MATNEETNAAGTDTRPPMLVENDYESWKIRIHRYIRGKPNGKLIWKSIQNGPTPHPMVTDPSPSDSTIMPAPRKKLDSEFNEEENKLEMADTQAEIILSQGLPRHIFNNLNQTSTAKEIWENVEMLMQGSGRTIQQRKEDLFDEYERFRAIGNESIHDYFVRFHKLVNDMKITQLNIPTHQMNTKFVNNLPAYWGKSIPSKVQSYEASSQKELSRNMSSLQTILLIPPNDRFEPHLTQIANLLSGFQKQFPPTNNQLWTSSNSKTHATVYDGQIVTEPIQRKAPGNVGNTEPEAFPLILEEVPNAILVAFMANLSSTSATNSQVNEELSREQAYWLPANERASQTSNPNSNIIKERTTQKPDYVSEWCYDYAKQFVEQQLVPFYDHFKKHIHAANDTFFKEIREFEQIFDELEAEYEQCVLDNKNLTIEKKNLLIKNDCLIAECLEKDICSIVLTSDIVVPPSSNCLCEDIRSACDREHTKVLELEAEVFKQQKMVIESEKRNSHLQKNHIDLQLKFQNYKQCIDTSSASNAIFEINKLRKQLQGKDDTIRNLETQINITRMLNVGSTKGSCDQQAFETDRIQLKDTITSLRIQLDGLKVEHVSLQRRYDELSKANTHSRTANTEKLSALTAKNTKLKAQVTGKTSSGPSTSETPKVLAPGMYNLGSKYIPPPKRANWVKPIPLPKQKQVTFSEPPKPSLKPTQKPVEHPNKQTNVCVPMSTGVKPTSGASKTVPKRAPRNHSSLPVKSANARRVEAHHRTLNKKNRVDSNLLVKHSVSVSKLNNVCAACNKSLVFANHNDCLVMCDDSVNVKPHQTKRFKRQPKKEWKPIKRVWKPISKPVNLLNPVA